MRKHSIAFLMLCSISLMSMSLMSQTATKPAMKPATKAMAAAATSSTAIIDTTAGKITCKLFPDKAPIGVANFVGLAKGTKEWTNPTTGRKMTGTPLYNGTIFHRVIPEFMIQGGDPLGNGEGDPGFFVTEVPYSSLDGHYTIFGQCDDESVELVKKIARMPRGPNDKPDNPVKINKIAITGAGAEHPMPAHKPAAKPATPTKPQ